MLPAGNRLRRSTDFAAVVRSGARVRSGPVVVHQRRDYGAAGSPPLVGFVVSKAVGGSVVRHQVARRLRAQTAARLHVLPAGSATVVRALPPSAAASSAQLGTALDHAFAKLAVDRRTVHS